MNMIHARVGLQRIQKFLEADELVPHHPPAATSATAAAASNPFSAVSVSLLDGHDAAHDTQPLLAAGAAAQRQRAAAQLDAEGGGEAAPAGEAVELAVAVRGGTFAWDAGKEPAVRDLSLAVEAGSLVMVVGQVSGCTTNGRVFAQACRSASSPFAGTTMLCFCWCVHWCVQVGAGKSSLLYALLSEMHRVAGRVDVKGSIAYTAQVRLARTSLHTARIAPRARTRRCKCQEPSRLRPNLQQQQQHGAAEARRIEDAGVVLPCAARRTRGSRTPRCAATCSWAAATTRTSTRRCWRRARWAPTSRCCRRETTLRSAKRASTCESAPRG